MSSNSNSRHKQAVKVSYNSAMAPKSLKEKPTLPKYSAEAFEKYLSEKFPTSTVHTPEVKVALNAESHPVSVQAVSVNPISTHPVLAPFASESSSANALVASEITSTLPTSIEALKIGTSLSEARSEEQDTSETGDEVNPKVSVVAETYYGPEFYEHYSDFYSRAQDQRAALERLHPMTTTRYMAIDIENLMYHDRGITEIGVATWEGRPLINGNFGPDAKFYHYKIRERLTKHNKIPRRGENFDHKNDFFGHSEIDWFKNVGRRIMGRISQLKRHGDVVIVIHGGSNDFKDLDGLVDFEGCTILDTQDLDRGIWGGARQMGLRTLTGGHYMPDRPFHNAGNDTYYTMWVLANQIEHLRASAARKEAELRAAEKTAEEADEQK